MPAARRIPRVRRDLKILEEDGGGALVDTVVGAVHAVTRAQVAALRAMGRERSIDDVARRSSLSRREVGALVGRLESENLLETPRARALVDGHQAEHDTRAFDTPEKMVRVRRLAVADPAARWDCHACGMCCRGLTVPLRPDEIARIDVELYSDILGGRSFHEPYAAGGGAPVERILRQVGEDDRCVFLLDDGRCAVHARQGAERKPDTCRIFPLATVATAFGPRLTLRIACGSLHRSAAHGTPLDRFAPTAFALEKDEAVRGAYDAPFAGRTVGFARYAAIERRWRTLLDDAGATPAFIPRALSEIEGATIEEHALDRARLVAAIRARLVADERAPSPLVGWFASKLRRSRAMRRALEAMAAGREPPAPPRAAARFIAATVRQVLYACEAYKLPDLQVGLRAILLLLELILHTVGSSGSPKAASRATRIWWMAGLEDGELTPVIWEALSGRLRPCSRAGDV
ncbi:MAG: YkgJ family cysteine cluster protein [Deltaproteobacteria bacterium]|nr:YkgJ family cysteine cluster protein [Deltaproteobacteria bacterium]